MKRRIDTLIQKNKITGYDNYVRALKTDNEKFEEFVNYLTINVSEFYRNPDQWKVLENEVFPQLIDKFGKNLKIWSAACSTGDEPYTIVMMLSKHIPLNQISVLATDLDAVVLAKAKAGIYDKKEVAGVPEEFKKKYFTETADGKMKVSDEIKSSVTFKQSDLLRDPYPKDYHLIVCRNVLIYFTEEAKDDIFRKYFATLQPGGILFIGSTEQIVNYKDIGFVRKNSFYYEKPKA
jgi:chemotaxis protein methyltransferase CheR